MVTESVPISAHKNQLFVYSDTSMSVSGSRNLFVVLAGRFVVVDPLAQVLSLVF